MLTAGRARSGRSRLRARSLSEGPTAPKLLAWRDWTEPADRCDRGRVLFETHGVLDDMIVARDSRASLAGGWRKCSSRPPGPWSPVDVNTGSDSSLGGWVESQYRLRQTACPLHCVCGGWAVRSLWILAPMPKKDRRASKQALRQLSKLIRLRQRSPDGPLWPSWNSSCNENVSASRE